MLAVGRKVEKVKELRKNVPGLELSGPPRVDPRGARRENTPRGDAAYLMPIITRQSATLAEPNIGSFGHPRFAVNANDAGKHCHYLRIGLLVMP